MDLEQQLHAALAPRASGPELRAVIMSRVTAAAWRASQPARRRHRIIIVGVVLVVAAAASMLAMWSSPPSAPQVAVPAADAFPAAVEPAGSGLPAGAGEREVEREGDVVVAQGPAAPKDPPAQAATAFTVRVQPLKNDAGDAAGRSAVASMYAAFMDRLRAVPGVTLLDQDQAGTHPDYRITVTGMVSHNQFGSSVGVEALKPDGTASGNSYFAISGDMPPACVTSLPPDADYSTCTDAEGAAVNMVGILRKTVFPPDAGLRKRLQARLLDHSQDERQRMQALSDLLSFGRFYSMTVSGTPGMSASQGKALSDPALLQGAVDLATSAASPAQRAQAWYMLRGAGSPRLVQPLLSALRKDQDRDVRIAVLSVLSAAYTTDPQVAAALEANAVKETDPLARALTRRALGGASGDAAWRQYVLSSLSDASQSPAARIEALLYHMNLPTSEASAWGLSSSASPNLRTLLDPDAIQVLTELLPAAKADFPAFRTSVSRLAGELARLQHPAITDMLLASVQGDSQWLDRLSATFALGQGNRRDDPRVRAVLEKIRSDDPVPNVRQAAATILDRPLIAVQAPDKPHLGVVFATPPPGTEAPPELVGKLAVMSMAPGGAGEKAGLMEGDVLLEINGSPVSAPADVIGILDTLPRGVGVGLVVERSGQKIRLEAKF